MGVPSLIQRLPDTASQETLSILNRELVHYNTGKSGEMSVWVESFVRFLGEVLSTSDDRSASEIEAQMDRWRQLEKSRKKLLSSWQQQDRYLDQFESNNK